MALAFVATGFYAWLLFRDNLRISTFSYVWAASVIMLGTGAAYHEATGIRASYVNGPGEKLWLSWSQYGDAMLAAAVGIICLAIGHYWSNRREWRLALPELIDSRAPDPEHLRRWAFFLLLAGFIPLAATGILNPITLVGTLLHGRHLRGPAVYLESAGTYFAFFSAFSRLVPFGMSATAILLWGRQKPWILLTIAAFLILLLLLSGTRSSAAAALAPFVLLPRYMGNRKLFRKLAIISIVGGFVLFTMQLAYRTVGFENVHLSEAFSRVNTLSVLEGTQLSWTGQAMRDYGKDFPFLDGQSYLAVLVNPVPRVFWHSKPDGYSKVNADNLRFGPGTTMTSAWMGEAYANFGWFGIPIVGLIAGAFMGILDVFIRRSRAFAVATFLPMQIAWAFWVRGDSVFALDAWLFGAVLLAVALVVVGPARDVHSLPEASNNHAPAA